MAAIVVRYQVNNDGLEQYLLRSQPLQQVVNNRAHVTMLVAKALAPKASGRLAGSIHMSHVSVRMHGSWRYGVRIQTGKVYGATAETGRKKFAPYKGDPFMQKTVKLMNTPKRRRGRKI